MSAATAGSSKIISMVTAATSVGKEGYGYTMTGGTATIGASATVHHKGICISGAASPTKATFALAGCEQPVYLKISGTVTEGDYLQQHTDGSYVVDAGSGARVVGAIALEAGVSGDLIRAALITPLTLS